MPTVLDYAKLANDVYLDQSPSGLGWVRLTNYTAGNGFFCGVYRKNRDIIAALRGTQTSDAGDLIDDVMFGATGANTQMASALLTFSTLKARYSDYAIFVTGHSLGGILTQTVCHYHTDTIGVTFNAAGHSQMLPFLDDPKLYHFRTKGDPLSAMFPIFEGPMHELSVGETGLMEKHSMANLLRAIRRHTKRNRRPDEW